MKAVNKKCNQPSATKALENLRMRMLDLTARNRLINFRHTKSASLRIIDELPNQLAEMLLTDAEMRFRSVPEPREEELIDAGYLEFNEESQTIVRLRKDPTAGEWAKNLGLATSYEVPEPSASDNPAKHSDDAIQTLLYPYELEVRLKTLQQTAESAIQEMGANILYLAFGFLEWFDTNNGENPRMAPLFLVPVRLSRGRLNQKTKIYEYTLKYSGEDIIPNLSLQEKLRIDFGMALPDLDQSRMPEDYFKEVQALIRDSQPQWKLRRYISLALLNFNKLLMYLDLDPERWPKEGNIVDHPVVSRFLAGYTPDADVRTPGGFGFGEEYPVDEIDDIHDRYPLIDDADSSQHSAIIDAVDGRNLVIEGPPGTGKSQTITNLIAAAIAQGKKVLFVAEKLAALEVVRRRLDTAGLGEFCLELHSHKSQKRKVLDEIDSRLKKHGHYRMPKDIDVDIARYEELKESLKSYAEQINRPWKNTGKTLNEIFMAATRYRNALGANPEIFHPQECDGGKLAAATQRRNEDQVEAYRKVGQGVAGQIEKHASLQNHPWFGVRNGNLQMFDLDRVNSSLGAWQDSLRSLVDVRERLIQLLDCRSSDLPGSLRGLSRILSEIESVPVLKGNELLESLPLLRGDVLSKSKRYFKLFIDIQNLYASLITIVGPEILQDLAIVDQLSSGSKRLKKLVRDDVTLGELAESFIRLARLENQLEQLNEPLHGLADALGETGLQHLKITQTGLNEFNTVIEIVSSLSPSCWQHRDAIFDNEELDQLLPALRADLEELRRLHDVVQPIFSLDGVPFETDIRQLREVLAAGGVFRWFKSSWRAARKRVLGMAAQSQIRFSTLESALGDLVEYSRKRYQFESNLLYQRAFGDHLRGVETDLDTLESLRNWYKRVRHQYGVGFGKKVALGDAILGLSPEIARAVRSLFDRGVRPQIHKLLDDLNDLKEVFSPVSGLRNGDAPLIGERGIVTGLLNSVDGATRSCEPLASDRSVSIGELIGRVEQMGMLRQKVDIWQRADYDNKIFHGRLGLQVGVDTNNSAGLSVLRNTLKLADRVEHHLTNQALVHFIYGNSTRRAFSSLVSIARDLRCAISEQLEAFKSFSTLVQLDQDSWFAQTDDHINDMITRNQLAMDNAETLQNWLDYVRERERLEARGLAELVYAIERGELAIEQVKDAYMAGIYDMLAREILKEEPGLGRFSGHSQEALQDKFREYDNKLKKLQCERIAWKIDQAKVPSGNAGVRVGEFSEKTLIEHECGKKKRHIPIRQLLQRSGNAMVAMKPCFMMSPMSVAQYLAPGKISFDLVVMDEASQIRPQDALGAIARGGQLVVVGDPKQLPPTSFFDRVLDEDKEDPTVIEESESILDATRPMFPARRLRWHYRSQHEQLIAFSNYSFYESDLIVFPSPHDQSDDYGLKYYPVPRGCFVNRRNIEEARAISEAVRDHLIRRPEETLGVVAMSADQRLQIERAIEALAKDDSVFREKLDKDATRQESLFIKNLENVQGDERDVIFISMTYGPQEPGGNVFQRFGPINSDVGWRRLNVLFTRSRKRMHIFSSMKSDDIIIGSSSKRGVRALRDFLAFCETGVLHKTEQETGRAPDSDFEIAVMTALGNEGFECVPQVGVAGFFIDVAVRDPGNPGRYLMGIECDGATYHSAKSARDRDRLRQTILERLGWNIRRIWSTDWFKNPQGVLQPLIRELHELKSTAKPREDVDVMPDTIGSDVALEDVRERSGDAITEKTDLDLRGRLMRFNRDVICKEHPETPENRRLLRPAMLEALIEFTPTSKVEFLELIPSYIRLATEAVEGEYLERIFDIINTSLEEMEVESV